jgi:hypothetical protein
MQFHGKIFELEFERLFRFGKSSRSRKADADAAIQYGAAAYPMGARMMSGHTNTMTIRE